MNHRVDLIYTSPRHRRQLQRKRLLATWFLSLSPLAALYFGPAVGVVLVAINLWLSSEVLGW